MTTWLSPDEERAWRGLQEMTSKLDAQLNRQLQHASGLSLADYGVLVRLTDQQDGRLRAFQLAHDLGWEQSRLSHHLARMQKRGLVQREECSTDGRGAFVVVSEAGRSAIERAAPGHAAEVRRLVFDALSAEQIVALESLSKKVLTRLASSPAPSPIFGAKSVP